MSAPKRYEFWPSLGRFVFESERLETELWSSMPSMSGLRSSIGTSASTALKAAACGDVSATSRLRWMSECPAAWFGHGRAT